MKRYVIGLGVAVMLAIARTAHAACVWGFEPGCDDAGWYSFFARVVEAIFG